ncbi:MAG: MerR family transcriptional regulator [Actinomycetota bacterium]
MFPKTQSNAQGTDASQIDALETDAPKTNEPELARLTVAAVARRLGISPCTLRTWDRRYGLGPTERCIGEHRKYSATDLARLLYMRKLVISGTSPAEAARLARDHNEEFTFSQLSPMQYMDGFFIKTLYRTAQALDRKGLEEQLRTELSKNGAAATWANVLVPLLCIIGVEWERTGEGIAAEHMTSDVIKKLFAERTVVEKPKNITPVLLACVGDEMHSLAIAALAASLAEVDIQVQFLGARTPASAINEVVRRFAPPAIFLWAQLPENASIEIVAELPAIRPAPRVILGGPGWAGREYEGAYVAEDLVSACREITHALGL